MSLSQSELLLLLCFSNFDMFSKFDVNISSSETYSVCTVYFVCFPRFKSKLPPDMLVVRNLLYQIEITVQCLLWVESPLRYFVLWSVYPDTASLFSGTSECIQDSSDSVGTHKHLTLVSLESRPLPSYCLTMELKHFPSLFSA